MRLGTDGATERYRSAARGLRTPALNHLGPESYQYGLYTFILGDYTNKLFITTNLGSASYQYLDTGA